ncbi:UDP-N-acetylmuramoyl-L-alanyl-D-glutamate--2,6-diaminopimelate ligase [Candidatus Chrysopegis kryptomonas]|jgi:UDP-N-acetylmuramoyl-L-alanyl-D-glutamate--2,6-diaminopimelate ligase|uniref:UDP-N-acetylmuramoyl-L-alanyl-D-glutamate--2,6-diaminopimelate ligase n=1 Tax=Candidatus Chryseopegocella kryptomonas TaxID=1633643 RepID=A0A0P1MS55_9BACT|nr:UDP-N-acetylmuramoyl-L-alanyl-D-glutamate--2,6-diaminopimelate ligase [Candidatus Chrysopegis kryptomonas]CUS98537.1 UDP-N-acetylmuramoylalanyl-D-glutamate--2,6-diaminopimelate ligase [Candidatus Chrysopegis kryptomonas]
MKLKELLKHIKVVKFLGDEDVEIKGIVYDSREVDEGDLFVAIKGLNVDGHRFIPEAVLAGAVAVVLENDGLIDDNYFVERGVAKVVVNDSRKALALLSSAFYEFPSKKLKLVGVTGTNGKTTTTHLIKSILETAGLKTGLIGTINYVIGDEIIPAGQTTPESLEINRFLKKMVDNGFGACVMEVSSHALALDRVYGLEFDVGVFTNLTQDHLDFHRTFEAYFQAKKILFDSLNQNAYAIYNVDDQYGERIVSDTRASKLSYGKSDKADVKVKDVKLSFNGTSLIVQTPTEKSLEINSKLIGEFNVYNILSAVAVGYVLGVEYEDIKNGIEKVENVKGRFEKIISPDDYTVIIDYAHTPDALEKCIDTILRLKKEAGGGKLITVFGCGGDRDKTKRPIMGRISTEKSDITIITSDNPRFEDPEKIISDIVEGVKKDSVYYVFVDRKEAIERALEMAQKGDIVLIAGKGHEEYQVIGDVKVPFSDRQVVMEFFKTKEKTT